VRRGMGSSQTDVGGLAHPQATYMNPKLFLLLVWETIFQKHIFGGIAEGEWSIFSICFEQTGGSRPYL
jgi:hypothetical protein